MNWFKNFWNSNFGAKVLIIGLPLTGLLSLPLTYFQDGMTDFTWLWISIEATAFYVLLAYLLRNWE